MINSVQKSFGFHNLNLKSKTKIMNIGKLLSALCITASLTFSLTGCLKDDDFDNGAIQSVHNNGDLVKPIEIKLTAANALEIFSLLKFWLSVSTGKEVIL